MAELRKEIQALKDMGKLTDDDLSNEMREIDTAVRDAADFSNPKSGPKSDPKTEGPDTL